MEIIATILVCILILTLAVFFLGPQLLAKFFEKADEWEKIIHSMKGEK